MTARSNAWRSRMPLLVGLGVLILLNLGVLVGYRLFYDDRVRDLEASRTELEQRATAAREALEKVEQTDVKLKDTREKLDRIYNDVLGTRKERLAKTIEEIYAITRKAGLRPDSLAFSSEEESASESFGVTFQVEAPYAGVKKLLAAFEASHGFFVISNVALSADDKEGEDSLRVALTLTRWFRAEHFRMPRGARASGSRTAVSNRRSQP